MGGGRRVKPEIFWNKQEKKKGNFVLKFSGYPGIGIHFFSKNLQRFFFIKWNIFFLNYREFSGKFSGEFNGAIRFKIDGVLFHYICNYRILQIYHENNLKFSDKSIFYMAIYNIHDRHGHMLIHRY